MTETLVRHEILLVAETVAREKGVTKEEVLCAMEHALCKAAQVKYGEDSDIVVEIDRKNGAISLFRRQTVVDLVEHPPIQIALNEAQRYDATLNLGDVFRENLPPIDFGRVAAQVVRQVVSTLLRDAVRQHEYDEYKDRTGDIISGVIKSIDFGNAIIDLGRAEGLLRRNDMIPREVFRPGDRVRAYIREVRRDARGHQILLSRTHPQFMAKLFAQEVPEVYSGVIEIKAVARDPGSRAKMGVLSKDSSIDPIGSCVGVRGSRVQAVTQELQGERVDIIPWSADMVTFVVNALTPAEVTKVVMGDNSHRLEVVVPDEQLSLAIGRRGQNVRLACELTGMSIDILTESSESQRRTQDISERSATFMEALNIDDVMSRLLVTEGFETLEEIAYVDLQEFLNLEGFTEELAHELQTRAAAFLDKKTEQDMARFREAGGQDDLADFEGLGTTLLVRLAEAGVCTLEALADLSGEELKDIAGSSVSLEQANDFVMRARGFDPCALDVVDDSFEEGRTA